MAVWELLCADCGHEFRSLVMPGARVPAVWVCSVCGSRRAHPQAVVDGTGHPFSGGPSCGCCG